MKPHECGLLNTCQVLFRQSNDATNNLSTIVRSYGLANRRHSVIIAGLVVFDVCAICLTFFFFGSFFKIEGFGEDPAICA